MDRSMGIWGFGDLGIWGFGKDIIHEIVPKGQMKIARDGVPG